MTRLFTGTSDATQPPAYIASDCAMCAQQLCRYRRQGMGQPKPVIRDLARGDRLALTGSGCTRFWTVLSGTVATCATLPDGRRQIVGIETEGDIVCAMAFVNGSESWLEALNGCRVCEVDLSANSHQLFSNQDFMLTMFTHVHARLQMATQQTIALGRLDSMERMCLFLVQRARSVTEGAGETARVCLPMSREDIADYLGLNAETVSRLLSKLKKSRTIVALSRTEFLITDLAALERRVPLAARKHLCRPKLPEPRGSIS